MAKIKKTKVDGALVYPATIFPAVKDPNTGQTLTDKLSELGSNVSEIQIGKYIYEFNSNKINILSENEYANFKGIVLACKGGDRFKIFGKGGAEIYLYTFIDKDWKPVANNNSGPSANLTSEIEITASEGAMWLVVNFNITVPYKLTDLRSLKAIDTRRDLESFKSQISVLNNGGSLNLNIINGKEGSTGEAVFFTSKTEARNSVPSFLRKKGLDITYRMNYGWVEEKYTSDYPNSSTWDNDGNWVKLSTKCYTIIAASDSLGKNFADVICEGINDQLLINLALNKGNVLLLSGTYNISSPIVLSKNGVVLKGSYSSKINNSVSSAAIITSKGAKDVIVEGVDCGDSNINLFSSGSGRIINCLYLGKRQSDYTISVMPFEGISGINNAISKLDINGGIIYLGQGEYAGQDAVNLTKSNIVIIGKGRNTTINRSVGYNDILCNTEGVKGCIIRDLNIANSVKHRNSNLTLIEDFILENCYIKGKQISARETTEISVGKGKEYGRLSEALLFVTNEQLKNKNQRFEIHVYGNITETSPLGFELTNTDVVGHNAKVIMNGDGSVCAKFYGNGYKVKNIHFYKTGCYIGYQHAAAVVFSDDVIFDGCVFENASFSTTPFNQKDYIVSSEERDGCRRHGILVNCNKYGSECKTLFRGCTAIGSPFGYQNTRGWYLVTGAPKLYDCIGYGGGIGEFGHGIQNHRTSQAELHNCVGFAGRNSYRYAAGIRMQAMGNPNMIGCIGYGSCGTRMKYLGFTDDEITSAGGSMKLTIEQAKAKLVELNENTEESYGISAWANCGKASIVNCEGFAGSGINSVGLHIVSDAKPVVVGGIFGKEDISCINPFRGDAEQSYMTFSPSEDKLNKFSSYEVNTVSVTIVKPGETNKVGFKFYLETVEDNPKKIVDGQDMYGATSILNCKTNVIKVGSGIKLRAYVVDNGGNIVKLSDNEQADKCAIWVCYIVRYADEGIGGVLMKNSASPSIIGAKISGSVKIETDSNNYAIKNCLIEEGVVSTKNNVKVYDCCIKGNVDHSLVFAEKESINGSSNFAG